MSLIRIHEFQTEQDAQAAIVIINAGEGIPVSPTAITQTYCETWQYWFNNLWYIDADNVTRSYLGPDTELDRQDPPEWP